MGGHDIGTVDNTTKLAHYEFLETLEGLVTATGEGWETLRYDTSTDDHELILKGEGFSGTERIYVGIKTYQSVGADYYNLAVMSCTGYLDAEDFENQPNAIISGVPAHNENIGYWLTWNEQRIAFGLKIETVYQSAYLGKFLPYARPSQFPHPVVNGGMLVGAATTRYDNTSYVMPYKGNRSNMRMRGMSGAWLQPYCYPFSNTGVLAGSTAALRDTGENYHLMPIELYDGDNLYGALDGVFFISGFNNTVENTLTIGSYEYIVMRNVYRTGFGDYYALRMDGGTT